MCHYTLPMTDNAPQLAAIALGSNLGDRHAKIRGAIARLGISRTLFAVRASPLYETAPQRVSPDAPDPGGPYINAVAIALTTAQPIDILNELLAMEKELGRDRSTQPHGAPRPIDLDLLMVGTLTMKTPELTLPHPGIAQRLFVLSPLSDIAPQMLVPGTGRTVLQLRDEALLATIGSPVERVG